MEKFLNKKVKVKLSTKWKSFKTNKKVKVSLSLLQPLSEWFIKSLDKLHNTLILQDKDIQKGKKIRNTLYVADICMLSGRGTRRCDAK